MVELSRRAMLSAFVLVGAGVLAAAGLESANLIEGSGTAVKAFKAMMLRPAQVLDMSVWKIGLPTTAEVSNPSLQTFSDSAFEVVSYVVFTARCGDQAQAGSQYPRSELREMTAEGAQAAWSTTSGTHTLSLTQRITHLPVVKPELICGQIHNADYLILIELSGTKLYVRYVNETAGVLDSEYRLGTDFTLDIVASEGQVVVTYNRVKTITVPKVAADGCYFKAGCYVQSSTATGDLPTAYGQVEISQLTVTHQ